MSRNNIFSFVLSILIINFCFLGNLVNGQTTGTNLLGSTTGSTIDTFTINLNGGTLNSATALNITIGIAGGSAQLDNAVTFKGNGASLLLSDVNSSTNVITVVLNGSITDGKATIIGKLKAGSVNGNPTISVVEMGGYLCFAG